MSYRPFLTKRAEKYSMSRTGHGVPTAAQLGICHKRTHPYTLRHNGKIERDHSEGQKRFYSCRAFFSLADLKKLTLHLKTKEISIGYDDLVTATVPSKMLR